MTSAQRKSTRRPRGPSQVAVLDDQPEGGDEPLLCRCCDPRNPLVMRPDLGVLADGRPEFALCVLHDPAPAVYQNRGDGAYELASHLALSPSGEIVDQQGEVVARVPGQDFQRLTTVDDDDEERTGDFPAEDGEGDEAGLSSSPRTIHVDLGQDDFYRPGHG